MGRTVPTYRMHLEAILNGWMDYRRALRERDRRAFDRLLGRARQHSSAASYCAHMDPVELAFLSILLEMEKALGERDMSMHMHTQDSMAKNIAVADDVYEILLKEKREGESFSDVIRRWRRNRGSLAECHGLLADLPEEEFRRFRSAALAVDHPLAEELGWRKRRSA